MKSKRRIFFFDFVLLRHFDFFVFNFRFDEMKQSHDMLQNGDVMKCLLSWEKLERHTERERERRRT